MFYKLRLVNLPHSSVEDKVFSDLVEAKKAAEATGFSANGRLSYMLGYSVIGGWSK